MEYSPKFRPLWQIARYVPKVEGIESGLGNLDRLTGGLRPEKLNMVVGYSHHGKTSLMLRYIIHNIQQGKRCLFISGDDTDDMLLCKIIAMLENCTTEQVEEFGPDWREEYVDLNLKDYLVIAASRDEYITSDLNDIYMGAASHLSEITGDAVEPELVAFDYISILKAAINRGEGGFNDVRNAVHAVKRVAREHPSSVWMVGHQCRKDAADTPALTLNHLEYGGHQQADGVIIGCRRGNMATMSETELHDEQQCPKVWVSVMKNKVTGRKSPNPIGYPYLIDPTSGYIREILDSDKPARINHVPVENPNKVSYGI